MDVIYRIMYGKLCILIAAIDHISSKVIGWFRSLKGPICEELLELGDTCTDMI